ncbi:MAG TPA: hypothetical protein VFQ80_15745, partial [Thermomicrobiales bacterium]|nr:hypothetical protein [Thermomicrobiales bacterium]
MNRRAIGRIGLIGAFAAAALVAPWRAGGAQPATTCAGESYLAQIVAVGGPATPAASLASIASPAASPAATTAGSPAASPAATPAPLTIAWLAGASNAAATTAAADAQVRLIEPDASNPHTALRAALRQGAQAVVVDDNVTSAIAPELADAAADGVAVVALGADDAAD